MKKNGFLLLFLLIFLSGCSWLALFDTNPYDDEDPSFVSWVREQTDTVRGELLGRTREEVVKIIGAPAYKNDQGGAERYFPRNSRNVYGANGVCDERQCGPIYSDEFWQYHLERKQHGRYDSSGFTVFFYRGKVIAVDCG